MKLTLRHKKPPPAVDNLDIWSRVETQEHREWGQRKLMDVVVIAFPAMGEATFVLN